MKKILFFITVIFAFSSNAAWAHYINLELNRYKSSYNYFQLPNDDANRVNLSDDKYLNSHRINGKFDLGDNHFLYFLYAPLKANYSFTSNKDFNFNNSSFSADQKSEVSYKFNSYRVGYFKKYQYNESLKYWFGGVLKVRDAKIKIKQNEDVKL